MPLMFDAVVIPLNLSVGPDFVSRQHVSILAKSGTEHTHLRTSIENISAVGLNLLQSADLQRES